MVKGGKLLLHPLCVAIGTKERTYIDESLFYILMDELKKAILDDQSEGDPDICCSFKEGGARKGTSEFQGYWNSLS